MNIYLLNIAEGFALDITELLKLGSIGLSAIVIIAVVYLFKVESKNSAFNKSKVKFLIIFMAFGFLQILVTSGVEIFKYVYPEANATQELKNTKQELVVITNELEEAKSSLQSIDSTSGSAELQLAKEQLAKQNAEFKNTVRSLKIEIAELEKKLLIKNQMKTLFS